MQKGGIGLQKSDPFVKTIPQLLKELNTHINDDRVNFVDVFFLYTTPPQTHHGGSKQKGGTGSEHTMHAAVNASHLLTQKSYQHNPDIVRKLKEGVPRIRHRMKEMPSIATTLDQVKEKLMPPANGCPLHSYLVFLCSVYRTIATEMNIKQVTSIHGALNVKVLDSFEFYIRITNTDQQVYPFIKFGDNEFMIVSPVILVQELKRLGLVTYDDVMVRNTNVTISIDNVQATSPNASTQQTLDTFTTFGIDNVAVVHFINNSQVHMHTPYDVTIIEQDHSDVLHEPREKFDTPKPTSTSAVSHTDITIEQLVSYN